MKRWHCTGSLKIPQSSCWIHLIRLYWCLIQETLLHSKDWLDLINHHPVCRWTCRIVKRNQPSSLDAGFELEKYEDDRMIPNSMETWKRKTHQNCPKHQPAPTSTGWDRFLRRSCALATLLRCRWSAWLTARPLHGTRAISWSWMAGKCHGMWKHML